MLSAELNERITRIGRGTPMGETMRRYWMPALLSWELPEPDCPPVRVRLLGEDLVAFRATDGGIGMLDEYCPHRLTSLWLGRNEENGLRCSYHGWKFDVNGTCVEQMNEPRAFCEKVDITAYPTAELGGVIYTYMGPSDKMPPPPKFAWTQVPESHRAVSKVVEECNWLQALEGGIDTSHFTILHRALKQTPTHYGVEVDGPAVRGGKPELAVDITDYGYAYYGIRQLENDTQYVRARRGQARRKPMVIIGCPWTIKPAWSGIFITVMVKPPSPTRVRAAAAAATRWAAMWTQPTASAPSAISPTTT